MWVLIQPSALSFITPFLVQPCELDLGNLGWSWHSPSLCLSLSFAVVGFMSQVCGGFIQVIFAEINKKKKTERKKRKASSFQAFHSSLEIHWTRYILGERQSQLALFYAAKQRYHIFFISLFFFFLHRIPSFQGMMQTLNMCITISR